MGKEVLRDVQETFYRSYDVTERMVAVVFVVLGLSGLWFLRKPVIAISNHESDAFVYQIPNFLHL